jgi:hypothetical protein
MKTSSFLLASLAAGVLMGLLGGLPIISLANCLLCIWVWGSAALAVLFYRKFANQKTGLTTGQGALLGLVSGVFGAVIVWLIGMLTRNAAINSILSMIETTGNVDLPPGLVATGISVASLFLDLALYMLFGALGGILGTVIFKGSAPAAAAPVMMPAQPVAPAPVAPAPVEPVVSEPVVEEVPAETEPPAEEQPPAA